MSTKLIRRALIASGLFIGTAVAFSPTAFAGTTAGNVVLAGTVASTLDMTATRTTGPGNADQLVLTGDGTTAITVKVADLAITTNNTTGYTLTATEGNLTDGHNDTIAYKLASVNAGDTTTTPNFSGTGALYTDSSTTTAGANPKDLYIKYTPSAIQQAGTYGATIILAVTDKG
ncbi:hypothetical protein [Nostoc sp.]|uniref:hypothetical protein n=1 Tax=Nostoc sp. TaxID=1180 RepID=UPI002FF71E16